MTDTSVGPATAESAARGALERAREHLLGLQEPGGWWRGKLSSNVSMDAEDLLLREFLGIREERRSQFSANWIRSQQRADGSWSNFYGGTADLSTTVESYAALRLCGDTPDAEHMVRAREHILGAGGVEKRGCSRTSGWRCSASGHGTISRRSRPRSSCCPAAFPLNIYDFACWGRQTVAALTVVAAYRPARPLPFRLDELHSGAAAKPVKPPWQARLEALLELRRGAPALRAGPPRHSAGSL